MSMLGKAVEGLTGGWVRIADEAEEQPPVLEGAHRNGGVAQAAPPNEVSKTNFVVSGTATAATNEIEAAVAARKSHDLEIVLGKTPPKFQEFLRQKLAFAEALSEGGAAQSKIETVATKQAMKATGLTIADVTAAASAARAALDEMRNGFELASRKAEQERITKPSADITETETRIQGIRDNIAALEKQAEELRSGIQPKKSDIESARADIDRGKAVFNGSCTSVEATLRSMQAAILAVINQGKS